MANPRDREDASQLLNNIALLSEEPFGPSLVDDVRALSLEEKKTLLPKIGLAFAKIQSLYRFMEDSITADTRNRQDDLRPAALSNVLSEIPFLHPECLQINMQPHSSNLEEATGDFEAVAYDEMQNSPLASNPSIWENVSLPNDNGLYSGGMDEDYHHIEASEAPSNAAAKSSIPRYRGLQNRGYPNAHVELPNVPGMALGSEYYGSEHEGINSSELPLPTGGLSERKIWVDRLLDHAGRSVIEMNRVSFFEILGDNIVTDF